MKKIFKIVLGIVGIFLVLALIGGSSDTTQPNTQAGSAVNSNVQAQEQTTPEQSTQEQTTPSEPVVIASWEGESTKDTETFHVPSDQFKISWDTKPGNFEGNFIFTINNADGSFKAAGANVIGANNESTIVRGAGDYYLSITTTQPYKIYVETM